MKIDGLASITIAAILAFGAAPAFAQNEEHVQFVANIEFIKGHLEQSVTNKQANNTELAKAHSGHPIAEHYSLIEEEVEEHDQELNTELKGALTALLGQVNTLDFQQFQNRVTEINGMLDEAKESAISATERNDPKFNAVVMTTVLEVAEHEYEWAVENGAIKEMIEYQDATGFVSRAKATYDSSVKAAVPAHEDEEIVESFELVETRIAAKADVSEVETAIGVIVHELDEVFGLGSSETGKLDGWGYIDEIKELLDHTLVEYEEGEFQAARALAVEAYLENYEFIETDIEADDPELMEKIEINLREELTQMIDDRRPAAEVKAHIETIKTDLETARAVVTPEFPLAAGIALVSVAATILAGTYYARRKGGLFF
jgi:molybdenum-dependent DNA-binding transcriptional regulator ModE